LAPRHSWHQELPFHPSNHRIRYQSFFNNTFLF
jgi:hypothetical protein